MSALSPAAEALKDDVIEAANRRTKELGKDLNDYLAREHQHRHANDLPPLDVQTMTIGFLMQKIAQLQVVMERGLAR